MRESGPSVQASGTAAGRPARWLGAVAALTAAAVLALLAGAPSASLAATSPPSPGSAAPGSPAPGPPVSVKYYVVGPPTNGAPEYLFAIAASTLGNGNRAKEIFDLNNGRRQADGAALVDPTVLHPGWVLLLPPDASGPGVQTGPLPTVAGTPTTVRAAPPGPSLVPGRSGEFAQKLGLVIVTAVLVIAIVALRRNRPVRAAQAYPSGAGRISDEPDPAVTTPLPPPAARPQPREPDVDVLDAPVTAASGLDLATVRLAGVRLRATTPAWVWLAVDAPNPPAATSVAIGARDGRALCLDLAQAPDVITLGGDEDGVRRLLTAIVSQLVDRGVAVTIVDGPASVRPAGAHLVHSLAEVEAATVDPTAVQIVVSGPVEDDAETLRRLTARTSPRTVAILVGDGPPARWSVEVGQPVRTAAPPATAGHGSTVSGY